MPIACETNKKQTCKYHFSDFDLSKKIGGMGESERALCIRSLPRTYQFHKKLNPIQDQKIK